MVKQETIRKGSKVFFADTVDEPVTVFDNVDGEISVFLKKMITTSPEELYPVPISEEILIRSGFFKTDDFVFEHPVDKIEVEIDEKGVAHMHLHDFEKVLQIHALHELQHAYWVFTKKELTFN